MVFLKLQHSCTHADTSAATLPRGWNMIFSWPSWVNVLKWATSEDMSSKSVFLMEEYAVQLYRKCTSSSISLREQALQIRSSRGDFECLPTSIFNLWLLRRSLQPIAERRVPSCDQVRFCTFIMTTGSAIVG